MKIIIQTAKSLFAVICIFFASCLSISSAQSANLLGETIYKNSLNASATMNDAGTAGIYSNSMASAVSANGSVIVGTIHTGTPSASPGKASRYTSASGMVDLGISLGGGSSRAFALSSDGSIIVGHGTTALEAADHAFIYNSTTSTTTDLGTFGGTNSYAYDISGNGSIVVGSAQYTDGRYHAFKYTNSGMTDLHSIVSLGGNESFSTGISSNGNVIVGNSKINNITTDSHAYKYNISSGQVTDLGTLGTGDISIAHAASADGSVIVGQSEFVSGDSVARAFMYTDTGGMVDLHSIINFGGSASQAIGVSSDGTIIVGQSEITGNTAYHAFKYNTANSTVTDLGTLGGTNSYANAISADGRTIVGYSQIAGDSVYHAFVYRESSFVDVNNTFSSLYDNANKLNSFFNLKGNLMVNELNRDCSVYGSSGLCIAVSSGYSSVKTLNPDSRVIYNGTINSLGYDKTGVKTDNLSQGDIDLRLGLRLTQYLRINLFANQSFGNDNPDNFRVRNNTPLLGGSIILSENTQGIGAALKLSGAYNELDITSTRQTNLPYVEKGVGNTKIKNSGAMAEFSYGIPFTPRSTSFFQPFVGIRRTTMAQNAYKESSGASFPITYNTIDQKTTTIYYGARVNAMMTRNTGITFGGGMENDTQHKINGYSGTIDTLGSFSLDNPKIHKNRAFGDVGLYYNIDDSQRIGMNINYRKQALGNSYATGAYLNYAIGF